MKPPQYLNVGDVMEVRIDKLGVHSAVPSWRIARGTHEASMSTPRIVIVTGGAQNIGAAIVARFQAAGDTVICADLNEPELPRASPLLRLTSPGRRASETS